MSQRWPGWRSIVSVVRTSLRDDPEADHTKGPINRALILLAIPMMLEMVLESVFAVVDIYFVARLGAEAVAVVGITEATVTILFAIAIGLSMATTAMVARRYGAGDKKDAARVGAQALWVGLAVGTIIGIAGAIYAEDILRLMGASEAVVEQGAGYTRVLLGGSITILYLFLINAIFRGAGDAALAMRSLWLANAINIILDPLLIFGLGPFPEMGVMGAAVATTIGRGVGVLYQLYHLTRPHHRLSLRLDTLGIRWSLLRRLLRISIGGVTQFLIATSSWMFLMAIVAGFGSQAVAGYTIAIRIIVFTILPAWGLGNAAATLVGQNLGAGQADRAETSVWRAARFNFCFMVIVSIVFIAIPGTLVGLFSTDPAVIETGARCLRTMAFGYGFYAVGMIIVQSFNGAGDTSTPTAINFVCYWAFQLPLAWYLAYPMALGPQGVFYAILAAEVLLTVVSVLVFRRGTWKKAVA
ncbi:MAG: MATE family efflux transporter [Lysobacteraceae bacterium]|nr:MAG: MATE family efflux transporter [Xanthomonadaceae bacterium]